MTTALTRSEIVYEYILGRIVSFKLPPGIPIIEDALCEELNVSRTPLREALRRLEAEGFVHKVRNRGTFVRGFTHEDIVEISEIRKVFELYSLERCMEADVPSEELGSLKEKLENLDGESPNEAYYLIDKTFHALIMRYCANFRMLNYTGSINMQLEMIRRISAKTPNRLINSKQEHLDIIAAILEGDKSVALTLMKQHLDNVKKSTLNIFQTVKMKF